MTREKTRRRARPRTTPADERVPLGDDPLWYKDAVVYELHVRGFSDSNGDGIGDFPGLTRRLDYLRDLGVTALWLLPFYPSPLKDDGYDIADYTGVHPDVGTLDDFRRFLEEAHRRGLRVITELVINHTSDRHPWFQRARRAPPESPDRAFYVWSDTPDRYPEARVIFKDFEHSNWAWDPVAGAYYWHRFYSHQPDLNFDNPAVQKALFEVLDFWLGMGVDGLRLDAIPYLFEREGTDCENLPETHAFLRALRRHVDANHADRMLLAEANQWPEDVAAYFGKEDGCHMAFHFPLMPRLFMALRMEDRYPVLEILQQTPEIPETCQWALFLRNHDELTLEMVTDEERDYMYRVYAQDPAARIHLGIRHRLAPLLQNNRRKIELLNRLLLSLPGTPVLYYGDEIGMGDNIYLGDRNGVRTPMQWSPDRNAGFSAANPQRLYLPVIIDPEYHYESVNVETHLNNPSSLLWWTRHVLGLRKRFRTFGRGSLDFLYPENHRVLAYLRRHEGERTLVVANLSRYPQYVELDLSGMEGAVPLELTGQTRFPPIGKLPYLLTLDPYGCYWFSLEAPEERPEEEGGTPSLTVSQDFEEAFARPARPRLEAALVRYVRGQRWFGGKARTIQDASIQDLVPVATPDGATQAVFLQIAYTEGEPETYLVPVAHRRTVEGQDADEAIALLRARETGDEGVLYDATADAAFWTALYRSVEKGKRLPGMEGRVRGWRTGAFNLLRKGAKGPLEVRLLRGEQSNTSADLGSRFVLKLFRRLEPGVNPDLEMGRYLTEGSPCEHVPRLAGALEYEAGSGEPVTVALLREYVANQGDAWQFTLDALGRYLDRVRALGEEAEAPEPPSAHPLALLAEAIPEQAREFIGTYLEAARLLGARTAELHGALARPTEDAAFRPEPFTDLYRRALYHGILGRTNRTLRLLRARVRELPEGVQPLGQEVLRREAEIRACLRPLRDDRVRALRIRCHGDYHLGQVLWTGRDFVIIDFEGEPARHLGERRIKRPALRDVAGMVRSFHYAADAALFRLTEAESASPEEFRRLEGWARLWSFWVTVAFLQAYFETAQGSALLPKTAKETRILLDTSLLEKAMYEVEYEFNNRPSWVRIPLAGVLDLLRVRT